ncbi:redoxin domain-containing protein [Pseudocolwellia agarivorans]|uniref:redoxin domain-containing protein n=1 Tax=Pseudocolwellia agarivorans TaxID=1911682 RepID=UPI000984ED2D|nr:redoxin domain-containing protein [Pseudocolwellia agarivorans]
MKNTLSRLISTVITLLLLCSYQTKAADFTVPLTTLDNQVTSVEKLMGKKPIYLKFWASWCQPCMKEMPHLQENFDTYSNSIQFLAINIDLNETDENIKNVIEKYGLTLPIYKDDNGRLAQELEFNGTPYHVLIDKEGDVVHKGNVADEALDRKLHILAQQHENKLPAIVLESASGKAQSLNFENDKYTALYITATWCDWYLEKTRPAMSKACIAGQNLVNKLADKYPHINWQLLTSDLWTESKDLQEYINKYNIKISANIDRKGDAFFNFKIKHLPTLILLKGNEVVDRTTDVEAFEGLINKALR